MDDLQMVSNDTSGYRSAKINGKGRIKTTIFRNLNSPCIPGSYGSSGLTEISFSSKTSLSLKQNLWLRPIRCNETSNVDAIHCYVDAAWNRVSFAGGFGWVCYNNSGLTLRQGSSSRRYVASALVAEALALKSALSTAVLAGVKDLICFSDSKSLVALLKGNSSVTELQGILSDISLLSLSLNSVSFRYVPRLCNEAADSLAKNALIVMSNSLSESDKPSSLLLYMMQGLIKKKTKIFRFLRRLSALRQEK